MLTMIRKMLRSKLSGLLFILLIVAMGAWGITDVFSGGVGNNFAVAGNSQLTEANFDREVERQLRSATDDRGRSLSKAQAVERGMIDQIYQRELFQTTLVAYADRLGARATNSQVLDVIREDPAFATDTGTFDPNTYRLLLQQNGFTPSSFENFLQRDLSINTLRDTVTVALQPPASIAAVQAAFSSEQRTAQWFILKRDDLPEPEPVTDEDLTAYYTEQQETLKNPQRRRISLLNLNIDDFLNQSEFTDEELRAYYDAVKAQQFSAPDTRTWTEFVFQTEAEARTALGRIAGGAAPDSIDGLVNSAERTGKKTSMASQQLAERVFAPTAAPGGIFGPAQSGRFFTVARLESITPGEVDAFEDVREDIIDALSREQAIGLYYDSLSRLDNLIGTGASLEEIGKKMGTPVLSFAPVDRTGLTRLGLRPATLGQNPDILSRAFDLTEGGKTARFGQGESAYILRVDEVIEPFTPDLDDIREDLRTALTQQRSTTALSQAAETVKAEVEQGTTDFANAAAAYGEEVTAPDFSFTRKPSEDSGIPPTLATGVFSLRNEGDVFVAQLQSGDAIAIVQLRSIERPEGEALAAAERASSVGINGELANDLLEAFVADIQTDVDLKVNQKAFDAYKARVNPDT